MISRVSPGLPLTSLYIPLRIVVVIQREGKGNLRLWRPAAGDHQSERAYITSDQYFLVRFSLKSSSNVPPELRTRETVGIARLGLIPWLIPNLLQICEDPKDTKTRVVHTSGIPKLKIPRIAIPLNGSSAHHSAPIHF